jgi:hypothetical protein
MLDRFMLKELAKSSGNFWLQILTNPWFVGLWILTPFFGCSLLHNAGYTHWAGAPFGIAMWANIFLLSGYILSGKDPLKSAMFLPQIAAALFFGITQVIAADESWAQAYMEYFWLRIALMAVFLSLSYYFIHNQTIPPCYDNKIKRKRVLSYMSLGLWQCNALVLLFGGLSGAVMGGRAELTLEKVGETSLHFGQYLPHEVILTNWFPLPFSVFNDGSYRIFPWALLFWIAQVYFFSAIFEKLFSSNK